MMCPMHGGHAHDHAHDAHDGERAGRRLLATIAVSGSLMLAELVGGILSGSLALLADAGHMLTDVLALLVAWGALAFSSRKADQRRTYGYRRLEILAALANGVALVVLSGSIAYEAVQRWLAPDDIDVRVMSAVAAIGLCGNILGLLLLRHERGVNLRGAFLHVLGDTLSSVGVLAGAAVIAVTGWTRADAVISIGIAIIIVITSVSLLREVIDVLLEAAPPGIDTEEVRRAIGGIEGVTEVHDLHVWSITSGLHALSAHVVVADPARDQHAVLQAIQLRLRAEYAIDHSTLQIETRAIDDCGSC
jgi:cobalt-zinc-cadmium efflux system protein